MKAGEDRKYLTELDVLSKQLAMHVAAMKPVYLSTEDVSHE